MRAVRDGAFAPALLAWLAEAAGALEIFVLLFAVALLLVAVLLVNLPTLFLEVFADPAAFLEEILAEFAFEPAFEERLEIEEGLPVAGLTSAARFEARFAVVASAAAEPAFADLALAFAPLVETGTFIF